MDADESLRRLAQAAGIEARYWDIHGGLHEATPDTMRALLGALSVAADTEAEIEAGLVFFAREPWRHPLPPVIVARRVLFRAYLGSHDPPWDGHERRGTPRRV